MRHLWLVLGVVWLGAAASADRIVLAKGGRPTATIVTPADADE